MIIKWSNCLWKGKAAESDSYELAFLCQKDGLYIVKNHRKKYIHMYISKKGRVLSEKINEEFIRRLIMKVPEDGALLIFFNFMYIVNYFIEDNQNPDNFQLHEYSIVRSPHRENNSPMTVYIE